MSALIGFRIEFYDNPESSGRRLVGAAVKEDAFTVQAVPAKGDYVAVNILAGGTAAGAWWPGNVPFEQVHHLEHYPASVGGDEVPSAQVVIQTAAPGEYQADALVQHFTSEEWQVSSFMGARWLKRGERPSRPSMTLRPATDGSAHAGLMHRIWNALHPDKPKVRPYEPVSFHRGPGGR